MSGLLSRIVVPLAAAGALIGSVAGAALAFASTFALGKAFCYYYRAVHRGQVPQPEDLKKYYTEQFAQAQQAWKKRKEETTDDRSD